jgi:hypothetical protein
MTSNEMKSKRFVQKTRRLCNEEKIGVYFTRDVVACSQYFIIYEYQQGRGLYSSVIRSLMEKAYLDVKLSC